MALLGGDRPRSRAIFEAWLAADPGLRVPYQDRVQTALHRVGEPWEQRRGSVATEHLATAIDESLLNLVYPRLFTRPHVGKSVIVSCAVNEYHRIGGELVAELLELYGWHGYFLGANTPAHDLLAMIDEKGPDAVALSAAVAFNLDALLGVATVVPPRGKPVPTATSSDRSEQRVRRTGRRLCAGAGFPPAAAHRLAATFRHAPVEAGKAEDPIPVTVGCRHGMTRWSTGRH